MNKLETRREFLIKAGSMVGVGALAVSASTFITSCEKDEFLSGISVVPPGSQYELSLSAYPALQNIDGIAQVTIPGKNKGNPLLIKRKTQTSFVVLDSICPHQGCGVTIPSSPADGYACPCHNLVFSTDNGSIIKNPIGFNGSGLTKYKSNYDAASNVLKISI